jgi:aminoglycoside phosphotransferase (APT) family kinase protein
MNVQSLFEEPILEQTYLDPGYSDHATDVIHVKTSRENIVVRMPRFMEGDEPKGDFGWGLYHLFGLDMRQIFRLQPLNALLNSLSPIAVPQVLRKGMADDGRPYVIVEFMPGYEPEQADMRQKPMLVELGKALASIHSRFSPHYGQAIGETHYPLQSFHPRMIETMRSLVERFHSNDTRVQQTLATITKLAQQLLAPKEASLVMIDLNERQFLTDGRHFTALVDTDAYVLGPRQLDFIALEYAFDAMQAEVFAQGYSSILPLPRLAEVRPVYRYYYRLLEVLGGIDIDDWMNHPALFA